MFRTLQLTNNSIGAVAVGKFMPLGMITRKVCCGNTGTRTFDVSSFGADTISMNEKGYYDIIYNVNFTVADTGTLTLTLKGNGNDLYTISRSVSAGSYSLSLPYQVRVFDNCASCSTNNPMSIQIELGGVAITDGNSNIIVERVY